MASRPDGGDIAVQLDGVTSVDALIRPYVSPVRTDPPEGSRVVQVTLRAFPNPHVLADLDE